MMRKFEKKNGLFLSGLMFLLLGLTVLSVPSCSFGGESMTFAWSDFIGYWANIENNQFWYGYHFSEDQKGTLFHNWEGMIHVSNYKIVKSHGDEDPVLRITQRLIGVFEEGEDEDVEISYRIKSFSNDRFEVRQIPEAGEDDNYKTITFVRQKKIELDESPGRNLITYLNGNKYIYALHFENRLVLGDRVRMRTEPNTNANIIRHLNKDTTLKVLTSYMEVHERFPWYQVDCEGDTGWVYGEFLSMN